MHSDPTRGLLIPCFVAAALAAGCGRDAGNATIDIRSLEVAARPGSIGPNLAAGREGPVVLSWLEPEVNGHALRYAVITESGWSAPRSVASGDNWFVNWADFPSVTPVSGDLWAAHWLVRQPAGGYAYDVLVSLSTDAGASWSDPVKPHDDGTATEHGFVSLFPAANGAGIVWLDGRNMIEPLPGGGVPHGMTLRAATVTRELGIADAAEIDALTCDCCQTDVARTHDGAVAVYRDRTAGEIRDIAAARLTPRGWQAAGTVADDDWHIEGCPVNGPVIAGDGRRLAVAWFTAAGNLPRIRLAISDDEGTTWSTAIDVAEGDLSGHAGIALLPGERIAVSWVCEQPGGAGVCLRTIDAGAELGPVQVASGEARVPTLSVPQLARDGDRLVMAWTEEFRGTTRIASASLRIASLP